MKYLLTILLLFCGSGLIAQSTIYLRGDSVKVMKQGGNATFRIENATRDSTNGVLINIGNGITEFRRIRAINDSQFVIGGDTVTIAGATGGGGGSSNIYASNGLTRVVDTVKLGGTALSANTSIPTSAFSLTLDASSTSHTLRANNSSSGSAMYVNNSSTGVGLTVLANTNSAINATSTASYAAQLAINPSTTTTDAVVLRLERNTSGTAGTNMGAAIQFDLENASGTVTTANIVSSRFSTATNGSEASTFVIQGRTGGNPLTAQFTLAGTGQLTLNKYGVNSFTGTAAKYLAVTAGGALIEVDQADLVEDSLATLLNAPGSAYLALDVRAIDTIYIKNHAAGWGTKLDSTQYVITHGLDTPTLRTWITTTFDFSTGGGGAGSDTANLIFDSIPHGTSLPTAVFQSGDTLRTRAFGDSGIIAWTVNGAGKLVAYISGGATGWSLTGNTLSGDGIFGSLSNDDVQVYTNNVKRMTFTKAGLLMWNATAPIISGTKVYFNDSTEVKWIRMLSGSAASGIGSAAQFVMKTPDASSSTYAMYLTDNTNTSIFRISNGGDITGKFGTLQSGLLQLAAVSTNTIRGSNAATTTGTYLALTHLNPNTHTSGNVVIVSTTGNATMASGTGTQTSLQVAPIWALTSTAAGTLWGLKINPAYTGIANAESRFLEITSNATNWPSFYINQNRVSTTDATATTIISIPTTAVAAGNSMTYVIKATVIANRITGSGAGADEDVAAYDYVGVFQRVNGGVVNNLAETITPLYEDQAGWNLTSNISGTAIRLQGTGAASNNVSWHVTKLEVHRGGE